jgi:hypothetical protein
MMYPNNRRQQVEREEIRLLGDLEPAEQYRRYANVS